MQNNRKYVSRRRTWGIRIGLIFLVAISFIIIPARIPNPLFEKEVICESMSHSGNWEEKFELTTSIPLFHIRTYVERADTALCMDLVSKHGAVLQNFRIRQGRSYFTCGRNNPAGIYTVTVREISAKGKYRVEIGEKEGVTIWHRFLVVITALFIFSTAMYLWQKMRKGQVEHGIYVSYIFFLFVVVGVLLYLFLHEGGHAIASICFGNFDISSCDFFGLGGRPHSGISHDIVLIPWQKAIQAFAGPFFPTLIGYTLYCLWLSRWGRNFRKDKKFVDLFWSYILFAIILPYFGVLLSMSGLYKGGDYSEFIENIPLSQWQANTGLLVFAAVNGGILCHLKRHLFSLWRKMQK